LIHVSSTASLRFYPGRSTTCQLPNLIQHIDDGFQTKKITDAVFVDLIAVYDTVKHRRMFSSEYA